MTTRALAVHFPSIVILFLFACMAHAQKIPGTDLEERLLPLTRIETSQPSHTLDQILSEIDAFNPVIGRYPPDFHSEKERETIYQKWLHMVADAEYFASREHNEKTLYALSELYRQGHNMDVAGSFDRAAANMELCLTHYPHSVPCHFSTVYGYLAVGPEHLHKAEKSLNALRKHFEPDLNASVEGLFVFLYLHQRESQKTKAQIDRFIQHFPAHQNVSLFQKIRPSLEGDIKFTRQSTRGE